VAAEAAVDQIEHARVRGVRVEQGGGRIQREGEGLIVDRPQTRALYEQARSDSLEAGLLGKVFVDRPAQGAAFTNPLAISGSASRTFTLTIANWDGRILAERTIRNATGTRRPFSLSVPANPGLYPRGTLVFRVGGAVTEIALGPAR